MGAITWTTTVVDDGRPLDVVFYASGTIPMGTPRLVGNPQYPEAVAGALFLVSGAVFPLSVLPPFAQAVGLISPLSWWMEGVRRALLPHPADRLVSRSACAICAVGQPRN